MNWITDRQPEEAGKYLISLTIPEKDTTLTTYYLAYYNHETNQWFEYNPINTDNPIGNEISGNLVVNGYVDPNDMILYAP